MQFSVGFPLQTLQVQLHLQNELVIGSGFRDDEKAVNVTRG